MELKAGPEVGGSWEVLKVEVRGELQARSDHDDYTV